MTLSRCTASERSRQVTDPGRIVVAGDWHGNALWAIAVISDAARLLRDEPQRLILHLGDYGIWPGKAGEQYVAAVRQACAETRVTVGFIDGNHEDFTQLHRFDVRKAPQDEPQPGMYWYPRGTRWTWHGRTWLALGGAVSVDRAVRKPGRSWWPQEQITSKQARAAIEAGPADVMVTHDCPAGVAHSFPSPPSFLDEADFARSDAHRERLQGVVDAVQPRWLMHGHLHRAYQRECDFGYGPVEVTGLDCDGTDNARSPNYLVLNVHTMTWEVPGRLGP